jgi:triosephosphate isomerase
MNGDNASIKVLLDGVIAEFGSIDVEGAALHGSSSKQYDVLVLPSFVYLSQVAKHLEGSGVGVGSQDVEYRDNGAITGGVSVSMIRDSGCRFSLVGHSERRTLFGESDELIAMKFEQCIRGGVVPILCVGETLEERKQGRTLEVVNSQLKAVTSRVSQLEFAGAMVAYEPVWAIGTGESATPEQAEEVHKGLRESLRQFDETIAESTRILYGGSVTPENAKVLFANENVDGALVGGAALNANSFVEICRAAQES